MAVNTRPLAGYQAPFAPYPSVGYPLVDFAGAGGLSPRAGGVGGANAMASGTVAQNTGAATLLPSAIAKSTPLAIIVVVGIGYLIWHISSRV